MKNLKLLSISNNQHNKQSHLEEALAQMERLEELVIKNANFDCKFLNKIKNKKLLVSLKLGVNISSLHTVLGQMENLEVLSLKNFKGNFDQSALCKLKNLQKFSAKNCEDLGFFLDVASLTPILHQLTELTLDCQTNNSSSHFISNSVKKKKKKKKKKN